MYTIYNNLEGKIKVQLEDFYLDSKNKLYKQQIFNYIS